MTNAQFYDSVGVAYSYCPIRRHAKMMGDDNGKNYRQTGLKWARTGGRNGVTDAHANAADANVADVTDVTNSQQSDRAACIVCREDDVPATERCDGCGHAAHVECLWECSGLRCEQCVVAFDDDEDARNVRPCLQQAITEYAVTPMVLGCMPRPYWKGLSEVRKYTARVGDSFRDPRSVWHQSSLTRLCFAGPGDYSIIENGYWHYCYFKRGPPSPSDDSDSESPASKKRMIRPALPEELSEEESNGGEDSDSSGDDSGWGTYANPGPERLAFRARCFDALESTVAEGLGEEEATVDVTFLSPLRPTCLEDAFTSVQSPPSTATAFQPCNQFPRSFGFAFASCVHAGAPAYIYIYIYTR